MEIRKIKVDFRDDRGEISDILEDEIIDHITMISSKKDSIRGNHYHKKSVQYTLVLKGSFKLLTQMAEGELETAIIKPRDLVFTPPLEKHAFIALEDSEYIVFTRGPRGGKNYESDTYRLTEKLTDSEGDN